MLLQLLSEVGPVWQALAGTMFTWAFTAAGAALVFVLHGGQRKILDFSLGFAAGVMLAASYWSLLAPAFEIVEKSLEDKRWSFIPVGVGFLAGGLFVYIADVILMFLNISGNVVESVKRVERTLKEPSKEKHIVSSTVRERHLNFVKEQENNKHHEKEKEMKEKQLKKESWKRILLLIIAITVHNIPEGLAVGVAYGAVGKSISATFESACNLALGIGIQNFPEGLAVSLPLKAAGMSTVKSFWYGQLSGMVEPVAGVFGALAITLVEPLLPYSLAFAAGAMVYVVVDDIIPEAHMSGNGKLSSLGVMIGFLIMMSLDVGLS